MGQPYLGDNGQWGVYERRDWVPPYADSRGTFPSPSYCASTVEPYPRSLTNGTYKFATNESCSSFSSGDSRSSRSSVERHLWAQDYSTQWNHCDSPAGEAVAFRSPVSAYAPLGPAECYVTLGVSLQELQQCHDGQYADETTRSPPRMLKTDFSGAVTSELSEMSNTGLLTPQMEDPPSAIEEGSYLGGANDSERDDKSSTGSALGAKTERSNNRNVSKQTKPKARSTQALNSHRVSKHRRTKSGGSISTDTSTPASAKLKSTECTICAAPFIGKAAMTKHVTTSHPRPFECIFSIYGCTRSFPAKNEWKRHCSIQHLGLSIWRCDVGGCAASDATSTAAASTRPATSPTAPPSTNDFKRKDLFIQHQRRMHGPASLATAAEQDRFKAACEGRARRCAIAVRRPPARSICGCCEARFDGADSWDARMEHVARHMERADLGRAAWAEDLPLRAWLVREGLLRQTGAGGWRLVGLPDEEGAKRRRSS